MFLILSDQAIAIGNEVIAFLIIFFGALFPICYILKLKRDKKKYLKEKYEQMEKEEQLKK